MLLKKVSDLYEEENDGNVTNINTVRCQKNVEELQEALKNCILEVKECKLSCREVSKTLGDINELIKK